MRIIAKLSQRLLWELEDIRQELVGEVRKLKPEEFDWHPRPDMKSPKDLLHEIGTMEKVCLVVAAGRPKPDTDHVSLVAGLQSLQGGSNPVKTGGES